MWTSRQMHSDEWRDQFVSAVRGMSDSDGLGCRWWTVADDDDNRYAIVLGWLDEGNDDWRPHAKVAYQSKRSIMQCDYDVDWLMLYDPVTGDVWDTDVSVSPESAAAAWDWLTGQVDALIGHGFAAHAPELEELVND